MLEYVVCHKHTLIRSKMFIKRRNAGALNFLECEYTLKVISLDATAL